MGKIFYKLDFTNSGRSVMTKKKKKLVSFVVSNENELIEREMTMGSLIGSSSTSFKFQPFA